jgi:hypothetical protein
MNGRSVIYSGWGPGISVAVLQDEVVMTGRADLKRRDGVNGVVVPCRRSAEAKCP